MIGRFADRRDAGRVLATLLSAYVDRPDVLVLGLPRGGVIVAAEVARALQAPLDVYVVRKVGVPWEEELAMGAVADADTLVLNDALIDDLRLPRGDVDRVVARERLEVERRTLVYRAGRPPLDLRDRTVIVVDDGLATGATMEAAVRAIRTHRPRSIVVAVPVGARETCARLRAIADHVTCARAPEPFEAVGAWYARFEQTTDAEVMVSLGSP
jgi:predicted phosphoribosyltransferase